MRRALLALLLACASWGAQAQLWSSILDDTRGADWTVAGVTGGIPTDWVDCTTTACNTLWNGGVDGAQVTSANINSALSSAPASTVVRIPGNGTERTLSGGVTFANRSNVILRGQGANLTILDIPNGISCPFGAGASICVGGASNSYMEFNPQNGTTANWTAGYAKGTTVVTLSTVSGLAVGRLIALYQNDDTSDPGEGLEVISVASPFAYGGTGGGGCTGSCNPDKHQMQFSIVAAINGNNVTLQDPILANNWSGSKAPLAAWLSVTRNRVGVENLTVIGCSGCRSNISMVYNTNSWVKGVKSVNSGRNHVDLWTSAHNSVVDSYFYEGQSHASQSYGIECLQGSQQLVQNNILTHVTAPFMWSGSCPGQVIGYNYTRNMTWTTTAWQQEGHYYHGTGSSHGLHEGNIDTSGAISDNVHGPSAHITFFRNYLRGRDLVTNTSQTNPVHIYSYSRFWNFIGNVLGDPASNYHNKYEVYPGDTSNCYTAIYQLGFGNNQCSAKTDAPTVNNDAAVRTTMMRWGNYDTVNDATRWEPSEVPSAITGNYDNAVPGDQTLPNSFYLTAMPTWFGHEGVAIQWPPIGPDVTGGDLANLGGHVHSNPAKLCYDNSTFSGNEITDFNAARCYEAVSSGLLAPTGFRRIGMR